MWSDFGHAQDLISCGWQNGKCLQYLAPADHMYSGQIKSHFNFQLKSGPLSLSPYWTTAFNYSQLLTTRVCKNRSLPIYY